MAALRLTHVFESLWLPQNLDLIYIDFVLDLWNPQILHSLNIITRVASLRFKIAPVIQFPFGAVPLCIQLIPNWDVPEGNIPERNGHGYLQVS